MYAQFQELKTNQLTKPPTADTKTLFFVILDWTALYSPGHIASILAEMHWTLQISFFLIPCWENKFFMQIIALCLTVSGLCNGVLTFLWPPSGIIRCSSYKATERWTTQAESWADSVEGWSPLPEESLPDLGVVSFQPRWLMLSGRQLTSAVPRQGTDMTPACPSQVSTHLLFIQWPTCRIQ